MRFSNSGFSAKYIVPIGPRLAPGKSFDFGRDFAEIMVNSVSLSAFLLD